MESFGDGVVVFDTYGRVVYASGLARRKMGVDSDLAAQRAESLRPRLLALGGRVAPFEAGDERLFRLPRDALRIAHRRCGPNLAQPLDAGG